MYTYLFVIFLRTFCTEQFMCTMGLRTWHSQIEKFSVLIQKPSVDLKFEAKKHKNTKQKIATEMGDLVCLYMCECVIKKREREKEESNNGNNVLSAETSQFFLYIDFKEIGFKSSKFPCPLRRDLSARRMSKNIVRRSIADVDDSVFV